MKLDRKLIKEQAKQLIKNNIWKLLLITVVVSLLSGSSGLFTIGLQGGEEIFESFFEDRADHAEDRIERYFDQFGIFDDDYFDNDYEDDDFYNNGEEPNGTEEFDPGHFNDFEFEGEGKINLLPTAKLNNLSLKLKNFAGNFSFLSLIMWPLTVTLWGVYISLVRGKCFEIDESFSYVFSKTFDKNYFKKLGLLLLTGLFIFLLAMLFIIPGVIYAYKIRFANKIMAEHPELSPMEAINLSKRMTDGHKGELFALDLSFIPWILLEIITLGLAGIYVIPYMNTVDALYYVNFKVRCEQEGRIMPQDYVSAKERVQQSAQQYYPPQNSGEYYQPPQPEQNYTNNYYQAPSSHEGNYYYPPQETSYTPVDDKDDSSLWLEYG